MTSTDPRFTFDRRAVTRTPDAVLATLEFRERERPTLIRDVFLGPVFSRGEIVVDAGGEVRRQSQPANRVRAGRQQR